MGILDFLGGKKDDQEKEVVINVNDQYVMWEVDISNSAFNAKLTVDSGCQGIYIVNGNLRQMCTSGRWIINDKSEKRDGNSLKLIGVNINKTYVVKIGVGGVPYKDWEMNIETNVGMHGDCTVRMQNPWALYQRMGKANVTEEEVDEFIRNKISELLRTELALVLQSCDYFTVTTEQNHIASELVEKFKPELEKLGITCDNFSLKEIFFPEQYMQERKAKEEEKAEKKREREAQMRRDEERQAEIDAFNSMNFNMNTSNNSNSGRASFCPNCGTKVPSDAAFCPSCGKKI